MTRGKLFVIVTPYGAFYFLHEDKKDVSPEFTNLEGAQKFNEEEIKYIKENFGCLFKDGRAEVKKVSFSLDKSV